MFLRTKRIANTKLIQVVESFRDLNGKPRQRILLSLGSAKINPESFKAIIVGVEIKLKGDAQDDLFERDFSEEEVQWIDTITTRLNRASCYRNEVKSSDIIDGVILNQVTTEDDVEFGPEIVALKAWDELHMSQILTECGLKSAMIETLKALIINRLIDPKSEWSLCDWLPRTVLSERLPVNLSKAKKDKLYRASDGLIKIKNQLEEKLAKHEETLFNVDRTILLYDVTNTHFEGVCAANPQAQFGKNKQGRNDCRQIAIGMVFDKLGLALAHDVVAGNIADVSTVKGILERLDPIHSTKQKPIVIMDAGFASKENKDLLTSKGYSYLINITRSRRNKYEDDFNAEGFTAIPGRTDKKCVQVKRIQDPEEPTDSLILCKSKQRGEKEIAMLKSKEERFMHAIHLLEEQINTGKLKESAKVNQRIGRIYKTVPGMAQYYHIVFHDGQLFVSRDDEKWNTAFELCGDYVLRTNTPYSGEEIWSLYMTLLRAENGFRLLKGTLGLRPNYHQLEERVQAHVLLTVLAYHLLSWIEVKLRESGISQSWKNIREELQTHRLSTIVLPTNQNKVYKVRRPSTPTARQEQIYKVLAVDWKKVYPALITVKEK